MLRKYSLIEESKQKYQDNLLNSSFSDKFKALIRLQEKGMFFDKIRYKFSESFNFSIIPTIFEDLKSQGLIEDYCLGGATALLYYSTTYLTEDIDVFVDIKQKGLITDLSPIYSFLIKKYNAKPENEYLLIKKTPLQILTSPNTITDDAFKNRKVVKIKGKNINIFSLEYLIAIMLFFGKDKYKYRLATVKKENMFDDKELKSILTKYNLIKKWENI